MRIFILILLMAFLPVDTYAAPPPGDCDTNCNFYGGVTLKDSSNLILQGGELRSVNNSGLTINATTTGGAAIQSGCVIDIESGGNPLNICFNYLGNTGFGTVTPGAYRLYVVGNQLISGTLTIGGDAIFELSDATCANNQIPKWSESTKKFTCQEDGGGGGGDVGTASVNELLWNKAAAVDGTAFITVDETDFELDFDNTANSAKEMGINFTGNSTASQFIKMLEDTTNGTNFYMFQPSNAMSASYTRDPQDLDEIIIMQPVLTPVDNNILSYGRIKHPWTIEAIECNTDDGTTQVIEIDECDIDGANCTAVANDITCALTNTTGTITDGAMAADGKLRITMSTNIGPVTSMNFSIYGRRDSE